MKRLPFLLFFLFTTFVFSQKNIHHRWDGMLKKFVSPSGQVNYKEWVKEQENIENYLFTLAQFPPTERTSAAAQLAYWINAYNALTVQLILKHYPVKSIKDIDNPWDTECFTVKGKEYTLGAIEHELLRKMGEPRIHFAINCASVSCPKLLNEAYLEKKMELQLTEATRSFLKDTSKNVITQKQLKLSRIFLWFGKDFGSKSERLDFIAKAVGLPLESPKIEYLLYDWNLNN
ncbi:MAG: DUF547 domain-containing protein [Bacteroidetes bacterium]|nr:DUF547 domain-containing protein [Bacteroidota bacterium]